jgi:dihydroflavonol-4-reductase
MIRPHVKVIVLGGTGFVGSNTARALVAAGHEVAVLVRPSSPRELIADLPVELVPGDLQDRASLEAAFRGRDIVVHSAGQLSLWKKQSDALYRINVLGTRNVVEACLARGVSRLIYDGSVGIYAGSTSPAPCDEGGVPSAERYHSFHVISMALAEAEVWKGLARGLDAVLLHPTLCVGEGDRGFHSSWAIVGLAFSRLPFTPPGGLNIVDVRDVARAHVQAIAKAPRGGNYIIGGENLTNRAFVDMLREILQIGTPALPLPRVGMRALGQLGEALARLRGTDHGTAITLNASIGEAMSMYWFVDDSKARRELGHGPGPVRPAVERQVAWLREQGLLPESGFGAAEFIDRFFTAREG